MTPTFTEEPSRGKKDSTIQAILDAAGGLLVEKIGRPPQAREIAAKSGYSVGTIYSYFTSVGDVVSHLVLKRQTNCIKKIDAIIVAHDADMTAQTLWGDIIAVLFSALNTVAPSVLNFAHRLAAEQSAKPDLHDRVVDRLGPAIQDAARRDRTGSFRQLEDQELTMCLRSVVYLCRYPLLEGNALFGTPEHQRIVFTFMNRVLSHPEASDLGRRLITTAL
jgi:AcrR family transcriptional regulator